MMAGEALKNSLAKGISNPKIDAMLVKIKKLGGVGKSIGSGGGGFLLIYADPSKHELIKKKLKLKELEFEFESNGTQILYVD